MLEARDTSFDEIFVDDTASCSRTWTEKDVEVFSILSGDSNPLHMDNTYASTTQFGKRLVHGMLVGSLCSQLVGMYIPGRKCLYLKQQLVFKQPVFIGDTVVATGIVVSKSKSTRMLTISIKIRKNDSIVLEGEALVQVL